MRGWAVWATMVGLALSALGPQTESPQPAPSPALAVMAAAGEVVVSKAELKVGPVVDPDQVYSYEQVTADLQTLAAAYPGLITLRSIGTTPYGRQIWAAKLGAGPAVALIHATYHACEWLTTNLVMTMLDRYAMAWASPEAAFEGEPLGPLLEQGAIWFVPMVNPDGATLQQRGLSAFPEEVHAALLAMNGGSRDFSHWKANAQGIDLNRQHPADWENIWANTEAPAFANHKGESPLTAPEAQAMVAFTYEVDPELTVAYHSTGQVIYWHFHNQPEHVERDRALAEALAAMTGYALMPPQVAPSGGGYKDWFIQAFGRPGFTPEIAPFTDGGPPPLSAFAEEWRRNRLVGLWAAREAIRLRAERLAAPALPAE